ncbi:hypothetical protein O4H61_03660 [Roseovarius aestuarii]|nr:hypothetical protein [Roseovarius aestuarii]
MNFFAFGFAAVAISAVGAVDYINQANRAGQTPGSYGVSSYVRSFGERYTETREASALDARQRVKAKTHLPESPDGWQQQVFVPAEGGADLHADLDNRTVIDDPNADFLTAQTRKSDRATAQREAKAKTLEYLRGDQIVRLSAAFEKPEDHDSVSDIAVALAGAGLKGLGGNWDGYAVIQGVPFFRNIHVGPAELPQSGPVRLKLLAMISPQITLEVEARATETDLRALLEQVDYAALNAMLDNPLPAVGPEAPAIAPAQQAAVASLALEAMRKGQAAHLEGLQERALALVDAQAGRAIPDDKADHAKSSDSAFGKLKNLFGGGARDDAKKSGQADKAKPARLQLSGGSSCLEGSSGRFCRE